MAGVSATPRPQRLVLYGVSWAEYTRMLRAFAGRPGFRLTYDRGTLEIMSPLAGCATGFATGDGGVSLTPGTDGKEEQMLPLRPVKQRMAWQLAGLAVVLLGAAGTAPAAVQGRSDVYWLGSGDWQLREQEGEACLVPSRLPRGGWPPPEKHREWTVSTPTIKSKSGKFLACDPEGRSPTVHLVKDKGANTRWTFDIVSNIRPGPANGSIRLLGGG